MNSTRAWSRPPPTTIAPGNILKSLAFSCVLRRERSLLRCAKCGTRGQVLAEALRLPPSLVSGGWSLRLSTALDAPFLRALYASSRTDAAFLALQPASQREPFLDDQFRLQDVHYRRHHSGADFLVIEQHGKPAGRLILDRSTREWRIVDIALLPSLRGQGVGLAVLETILEAAAGAGAAHVNLQVEATNRARALYRRLGFAETGESGLHVAMTWTVS